MLKQGPMVLVSEERAIVKEEDRWRQTSPCAAQLLTQGVEQIIAVTSEPHVCPLGLEGISLGPVVSLIPTKPSALVVSP